MSELAQSLIQSINDEHAARLGAVEANIGRIEETEALATTLRRHGLAEAKAVGFVLGGVGRFNKAEIRTYVTTSGAAAQELTQALHTADLRISHINMGTAESYGYMHLYGLDIPLLADRSTCLGVATHRDAEVTTHA